ncbi:MAG: triacylglycerol lipase, partial [Coriobacteriia bacterium]|nr:triacylglycerol lipase [Coriobacteriia bacterium]
MPAEPNTTDRQPKDSRCATRWPILLVHGVAFKHAERTRYWGRLPALLRQHGARVYISEQDAWGSIESNARQLQAKLEEVLAAEQTEKVNIIAHSKGGLDSRRLAAFPGIGERIASLTTISSPHHGIKALNWVNRLPETVLKLAS